MLVSFSHLWQQEELSDVDVLLTAPADQQNASSTQTQKLAEFPGHTALLSSSPYLKAQILRWQRKRKADEEQPASNTPPEPSKRLQQAGRVSTRSHAAEAAAAAPNNNANSSSPQPADSSTAPTKRQLVLALQDPSEQPAAMAVLAAMYVAKPLGELLSELSDEQQLQAAMLADLWQLPAICKEVAGALSHTLSTKRKLSDAATEHLLSSQAVPDSLQVLLRRVLLSLLGNLESCWADAALQEVLLALPLPHMELLLSCDELKVSSEDTVLYTVQRFMDKACRADTASDSDSDAIRQRIQERLAPLIRCQHLSQYWLTLSVLSDDADTMPLAQLKPQVKQLLLMRSVKPRASITPDELKDQVADAPPSWQLGKRASAPVSSVQLVWELDVAAVRQAAQRSAARGKEVAVTSPCVTPPLGGMAFGIKVCCTPSDDSSGTEVGLFAVPRGTPSDAAHSFCCRLGVSGVGEAEGTTPIIFNGWGWSDFFELGPMAGGWDAVAWAAQGLPASGTLVVKLVVSGVAQVQV